MMGTIKNILFWFACFLVVLTAGRIFGPELETKFWPVYSKFEIVSMNVVGDHQTEVVFKFEKLRLCESRSATWLNGELGQQIDVVIGDSPKPLPRPLGVQTSRPYTLNLTPDEVTHALVAVITSRCPFMPWDTRSEVFP